ncbi:VIT1/CCC1 transporter family protein [Geothrix sp. 21YS21S-2]|uniref:VIT1/CCC1 transporter family protein n=1 Tax=Geothrix sp. 21YS21S-2 TaxID=3068893 RepID=UPI0027BA33CC|nr:VIT1/CCC1 transporter family protein [Geothrix sp. 21YS21S-2]
MTGHRPRTQPERHRSGRSGWLRAAILGSDDAIVSTASLMIRVSASRGAILVAGVAGLGAGATSMPVTAGIGRLIGSTVT